VTAPSACERSPALRALDRRGRVRFTDIADPRFDPEREGLALVADADGSHPWSRAAERREVVEGVEVFRALYEAVGLGVLVRWTRVGPIDRMLTRAYAAFASRRLRLTGRCDAAGCALPRRRTQELAA
jgi:predicted DCC family thiol-disulfide oxidoreductase YuxK